MRDLYYWRYSLRSSASLNAASSRRAHCGALIRVGDGFGCLHPWPELGDTSLDEQLAALAKGKGAETALIRAALLCAEVDGAARREERTLFEKEIPESHWLVGPRDEPEVAWEDGFRIAKLKGSPDLSGTRAAAKRWASHGFRIRLDFNETLGVGEFLSFWDSLNEEEKQAIEFVEDPESWSEQGWQELRKQGVPIAVDREADARWVPGDVYVWKPACETVAPNQEADVVVTSYMDHALGQMYAAYRASVGTSSERQLPCGLHTHRCFDSDDFFEQIATDGPRLLPVKGTGLGFDEQLEALPWKRLS